MTEQEWNQVIDVNLTGVWNGCQVFGKRMVDAGGGVDRQRRLDLGADRQPAAVATRLQRVEGRASIS